MAKLPYLAFYVDDHLADELVSACSFAAQGLWTRMFCMMHKSSRRGYLLLGDTPPSLEQLSRMVGGATAEVSCLLHELRSAGVPGWKHVEGHDLGLFYSRRIVRDETKRQKCSEAGKKGGGNPTFIGKRKGRPKGEHKGAPKPPLGGWEIGSGSSAPLTESGGANDFEQGFAERGIDPDAVHLDVLNPGLKPSGVNGDGSIYNAVLVHLFGKSWPPEDRWGDQIKKILTDYVEDGPAYLLRPEHKGAGRDGFGKIRDAFWKTRRTAEAKPTRTDPAILRKRAQEQGRL